MLVFKYQHKVFFYDNHPILALWNNVFGILSNSKHKKSLITQSSINAKVGWKELIMRKSMQEL
jgi:hypothetical protein